MEIFDLGIRFLFAAELGIIESAEVGFWLVRSHMSRNR